MAVHLERMFQPARQVGERRRPAIIIHHLPASLREMNSGFSLEDSPAPVIINRVDLQKFRACWKRKRGGSDMLRARLWVAIRGVIFFSLP
jgi:hypothetical protein